MPTRYLTDGGLETDLIFLRGVDLPEFAAFPLLDSAEGRAVLDAYYLDYLRLAAALGTPLLLETPTWRANPDHGALLGYDTATLDAVNRAAVDLLADLAEQHAADLPGWQVGGIVGPRGDGYRSAGPVEPERAAEYHRAQLQSFVAAGAHRATALTLTEVGEAIGVVWAADAVGLPVAIGFTVETDGRLPDGTTLADAVAAVDEVAPPAHYLINCAHPSHVLRGLDEGAWRSRIGGLRCNASAMSHAELDQMETLDDGDPAGLAADQRPLLDAFGELEVLGGCCGTDIRHVAAMWGAGA
ncbi:homocysteine S-methyltransferase family protein [Nocardioides sp. Bht2]|uniref:homocysteine S-methyltransferase family protein n=1 Tax=Nocardioides sp. Bht2 TaxID=3392297 RepID=UPI0039B66731